MVGRELLETTQRLAAAVGRGDAVAAAALYAREARLLTPAAGLLVGRGDIEAYWRAGISLGVSRLDLDPIEREPVRSVAVELGRYALSAGSAGDRPVVDRGTYLALHRRQDDGSWLRAVEVFNPEGPASRPERREPC